MKLRLWHILFFALMLVVSAIAFAPASLFVRSSDGGFAYRNASGTIWQARFEGVSIGAYDAGTMDWRLSLFDLLSGKIQVDLSFAGGDIAGDVQWLGNFRGDRRVIAPDLTIEGAPIDRQLTLAGPTRIEGLDVYFSDGACVTAVGRLTSEVLARNAQRLRWTGPTLGGEASCQGDAAQLAMHGAADGAAIQTVLELRQSGEGVWRVFVDARDPALRTILTVRGFIAGPGGNLTHSRSFTWLPS